MNFDINRLGCKNTGDNFLKTLLKSPAVMVSGLSTTVSPENPNELCDRRSSLVQKKQAGNNSKIIEEEIFAIADKLLEYTCIFSKQHKFLLVKRLN